MALHRLLANAIILFPSLCGGLDLYNHSMSAICHPKLPTASFNDFGCSNQTFQYTQEATKLFDSLTTVYDVSRKTDSQSLALALGYRWQQWSADMRSVYNEDTTGDTAASRYSQLFLQYRTEPIDDLLITASEKIYLPGENNANLTKYTSSVDIRYPFGTTLGMFVRGSRSVIPQNELPSSTYQNPYTFTTGVSYEENVNNALKASYSRIENIDPAVQPSKKVDVSYKRKISKHLKTTLDIGKYLDDVQQFENTATLKLNYSF